MVIRAHWIANATMVFVAMINSVPVGRREGSESSDQPCPQLHAAPMRFRMVRRVVSIAKNPVLSNAVQVYVKPITIAKSTIAVRPSARNLNKKHYCFFLFIGILNEDSSTKQLFFLFLSHNKYAARNLLPTFSNSPVPLLCSGANPIDRMFALISIGLDFSFLLSRSMLIR